MRSEIKYDQDSVWNSKRNMKKFLDKVDFR